MSVNASGQETRFFRSLLGQSSGLLLWMSVVLHSAIAFLPLKKAPERPQQSVVELPPPITVTRLSELSPVAVQNSPDAQAIEPPQAIEPQPVPQIVIPQPVPPAVPNPAPLPVMAEPLSNMSVENAPDKNVPDKNAPDESTSDESMPGENGVIGDEEDAPPLPPSNEAEVAAMAAVWEGFLGSLQGGLSGSNLQQILSLFGQPEQADLFFDAEGQAIVSVVSHHLLEDKTPEQVLEDIVKPGLMSQEGFEIREYGEFADGPVYEVVQGEIVHYLNIVPLNVDSVLIVCNGECPSS